LEFNYYNFTRGLALGNFSLLKTGIGPGKGFSLKGIYSPGNLLGPTSRFPTFWVFFNPPQKGFLKNFLFVQKRVGETKGDPPNLREIFPPDVAQLILVLKAGPPLVWCGRGHTSTGGFKGF